MNLWKKIMLGAATSVAVAAFALGVSANPAGASAAESSSSGNALEAHYCGGSLDITYTSGDALTAKVYVATLDKNNTTKLKTPTVVELKENSEEDCMEATISLTSLSVKKNTYIKVVVGDAWRNFYISAANTIKSAKVIKNDDSKMGMLEVKDSSGKDMKYYLDSKAASGDAKYYVKSCGKLVNSSGNAYTTSGDAYVTNMMDFGATLEVYACATKAERNEKKTITVKVGKESTSVDCLYVGSFTGTLKKVKVPAKGAAPKISVDYVKNTINIPANVKYRVFSTDGGAIKNKTDWITGDTKKFGLAVVSGNAGGVKIGTASAEGTAYINAYTKKTNKLQSKFAELSVTAKIPVLTVSSGNASGDATVSGDAGIKSGEKVTYSYNASTKKATLAVTGDGTYEFKVDSTLPSAKDKGTIVTTSKTTAKFDPSTKKVYVRRRGGDGIFSSAWVQVGK